MKTKLINIANIQSGYSFRSKISKKDNGNIQLIQMKDLNEQFKVNTKDLDKIEIPDIRNDYLMKKNDLIFKSRGLDTKASILDKDINNTILAAPLIRIRIKNKNVLPEYVLWYINELPAQTFINRRAKGTFQKMITKQVLEDLEIEIPEIEKQKKILEIFHLANKESSLLEELAKKKKRYISKILLDKIKENHNGY